MSFIYYAPACPTPLVSYHLNHPFLKATDSPEARGYARSLFYAEHMNNYWSQRIGACVLHIAQAKRHTPRGAHHPSPFYMPTP